MFRIRGCTQSLPPPSRWVTAMVWKTNQLPLLGNLKFDRNFRSVCMYRMFATQMFLSRGVMVYYYLPTRGVSRVQNIQGYEKNIKSRNLQWGRKNAVCINSAAPYTTLNFMDMKWLEHCMRQMAVEIWMQCWVSSLFSLTTRCSVVSVFCGEYLFIIFWGTGAHSQGVQKCLGLESKHTWLKFQKPKADDATVSHNFLTPFKTAATVEPTSHWPFTSNREVNHCV